MRSILVDRPGCGLSDPIVGGPLRDLASVESYADRLLPDLLDALELERHAPWIDDPDTCVTRTLAFLAA